MDAMTTEELDSDGSIFQEKAKGKSTAVAAPKKQDKASGKAKDKASASGSGTPLEDVSNLAEGQPRKAGRRVLRVARGSGTSVREVEELLAQHQTFAGMVKQAGGKQFAVVTPTQPEGVPEGVKVGTVFAVNPLVAPLWKNFITHAMEKAFTADRERVVRLMREGGIVLQFAYATIMYDFETVLAAVRDVIDRFAPVA